MCHGIYLRCPICSLDVAMWSMSDEWSTDYDAKEKACPDAGYKVPEIVYWVLAGRDTEKTTEAAYNSTSDRKGLVMMTEFSPAMLKVLIEGEAEGSLDDLAQARGAEGVQKPPEEEIDLISFMKRHSWLLALTVW
ncbi:hypothetical protein D9613_001086 [Agrocybe pediades]|uniref:DUF7788 domain-containing protein n=1 Tax=Agrocybe pediades TaxID=84607 RepID=A0A8H4R1Y2_9AGAR|nr:hypothetical protein D9613_001086 [Agrocybe pediades]